MPCSRSPEGVVSQHALQVSRPTPRGEVVGSGQGVSRPTPRGSPGPHPGGVYPSMYLGRPRPLAATAAGSTHPTGMHFCSDLNSNFSVFFLHS